MRSEPEVQIFPGIKELSEAAAARFQELASARVASEQSFYAAVSGGSTPRRLYELLAGPRFSTAIPWAHIQLFQVDERCVPPDDPESNYRMVREALLVRAPIPEGNFHRMRAEAADRDAASREYAAEIARGLQSTGNDFPRFDLILLGMGNDGHTASLFPGSPALREHTRWVCPNFSPLSGAHRLTLTFPILNAAAGIIFLVSGAEKAETLRRVLEELGPSAPLPAARIRPPAGRLSWYVDEAAARFLTTARRSPS